MSAGRLSAPGRPPQGAAPRGSLLAAIFAAVAAEHGLEADGTAALLGPDRNSELVAARHAAIWLTRQAAGTSIAALARAFRRDRTTIRNAIESITERRRRYPAVAARLDALMTAIDARYREMLVQAAHGHGQRQLGQRFVQDPHQMGAGHGTGNLNELAAVVHADNERWWRDPATGERCDRNFGELIALVHSELSECLEAHRKSLPDAHLPHRSGVEVELVDALIRILDIAGSLRLDLDGAFAEKRAYNAARADHSAEARLGKNGKRY